MTVENETTRVIVSGNGVTTSFSYSFPIPGSNGNDQTNAELIITDTASVSTTLANNLWAITGVGGTSGTFTYPLTGSPVGTGSFLTLNRIVPFEQTTELDAQGAYSPTVVMGALDNLAYQTEQLNTRALQSIRAPITDPALNDLPPAADRAGFLLGFDNDGQPVATDSSSGGGGTPGGTNGQIQFNNSGAFGGFTASGDVTVNTGTGAATIASHAVTNSKMAQMANATIKGRTTAGTGDPEDLTATQTTALLNTMVGDSGAGVTKGLVPADTTGNATTKFLRKDGTWAVPAGGSGSGTVDTVEDGSTTVSNPTIIKFSGATVSESPSGTALVNISGGGGGGLPYGNISGPPDSTTFSWVNQGSCTVAQAGGAGTPIMITMPNDTSLNWRGRFINQPSTPYTLYTSVVYDAATTNDATCAQVFGIYFYDGTKLMGIEFVAGTSSTIYSVLRVEKITNVTTDSSTAATRTSTTGLNLQPQAYGVMFYQLKNDGSTLTFSYSLDGYNFVDLFSEAVGTFITPTQIGFGGINLNAPGTVTNHISLLSWKTA